MSEGYRVRPASAEKVIEGDILGEIWDDSLSRSQRMVTQPIEFSDLSTDLRKSACLYCIPKAVASKLLNRMIVDEVGMVSSVGRWVEAASMTPTE